MTGVIAYGSTSPLLVTVEPMMFTFESAFPFGNKMVMKSSSRSIRFIASFFYFFIFCRQGLVCRQMLGFVKVDARQKLQLRVS
jgi:hypothetical protein